VVSDVLAQQCERIVRRLVKRYPTRPRGGALPLPDREVAGHPEVVAAACALLQVAEDAAPWAVLPLLDGRFGLKEWGFDVTPLLSLNDPGAVRALVCERFGAPVSDLRSDPAALMDALQAINDGLLIGKATGAKMAYLKPITGTAFRYLSPAVLTEFYTAVVGATVDLLNRQKRRLCRQAIDCPPIELMVQQLLALETVHILREWYAGVPHFVSDPDSYYRVYADRIVQLLHDQDLSGGHSAVSPSFHCIRGKGIESAFAPRNRSFLELGDLYGDCTAGEVRSQVDPQVANIHWTVYSWLLDPCYRVVEVFLDGRSVLKGHLLPLVIHDRNVLMVDAIETIPSVRDVVRGRPNPNRSEKIYARRTEVLEELFTIARRLARAMGIEAVYVDKYSNTRWVRSAVDQLPSDSYHVADVVKPCGNAIIAAVVADLAGEAPATVKEEIQAGNLTLMDQYLQANHKEVGVLAGRREDYSIAIRGI
jgi:hypothetical protein